MTTPVNLSRRGFLKIGLAAPAVILTPGLLMKVASPYKPPHIVAFGNVITEGYLTLCNELSDNGAFAKALWPGIKTWYDDVYGPQVKLILPSEFYK